MGLPVSRQTSQSASQGLARNMEVSVRWDQKALGPCMSTEKNHISQAQALVAQVPYLFAIRLFCAQLKELRVGGEEIQSMLTNCILTESSQGCPPLHPPCMSAVFTFPSSLSSNVATSLQI